MNAKFVVVKSCLMIHKNNGISHSSYDPGRLLSEKTRQIIFKTQGRTHVRTTLHLLGNILTF